MKKTIYLSMVTTLVTTLCVQAASIELDTIQVEEKAGVKLIKDVSGDEIKSADLGEALFKQSPSVSLIRRSGIANDVRVRGQKKDNINVTIDGAKVCGACPNRMDPPISHVLTNNVDFIEINEGPYNVEDFGVLSADLKVHTIKPKEGFEGTLNLGAGSFGYQKGALTLSGGTEDVRFLLSASTEKGEQYEDGNGDDFVGQISREIEKGSVSKTVQYQDKYKNMDAFAKQTLMAKMFWNITDTQELKLSYTANRSDDILYPSSKMDAIYDDSDIYNLEYISKDLGAYSKELSLQVYQSEVEHPMSTKYRLMGATNYMTHALTTKMQGAKVKNSFDVDNHTITTGIDYSKRNWDGGYYKNDNPLPAAKFHSIWDVDTENTALFLKDKIALGKLTVDLGLRYDMTEVTSANPLQQSNDYDDLGGYLFATYQANEDTKYFAGLGKSSRVPDGKELYWVGSMGNMIGTPNLDATVNYELDMGVEKQYSDASIKAKVFYSKMKDYIAYNASAVNKMGASYHAYENVDVTLYGIELSGTYVATDSIYFDYGVSYQRGEKDNPLTGQTGTEMPDIAPLKVNAALNYDYDESLNLRAEVIASDSWSDFDAENGEQALDSYAVLNFKGSKQFGKNIELTVGIDNVLDETYAVSNTYKDLVLLPTVGNNEVMLMNEPGRYFYTNLKYTF
ncbi:MAG: TonB-dependent receptor [uncultured Sulfurovum sp.]|uniref:TonB-dependent receptor n=1 Tax=uncultured Sulfurovum sp. TaxID=269237 RepID=A0A6S6T9K9_9BACT|nr:MAG: TonB-dependent receptor [uncultured Sulfurovum sp.]